VLVARAPAGAGYGDPLRRDPAAVAADVVGGLVSSEMARDAYGVVLAGGEVDHGATQSARDDERAARLAEGRRATGVSRGGPVSGGRVIHRVADAIDAVEIDARRVLRCTVCGEQLCPYGDDFKPSCLMRELPLPTAMPANAGCSADYVFREYSCPGCGTALAVDVQKRDEPILDELRFGPSRAPDLSPD
jgi:N-methylhydantoinase B